MLNGKALGDALAEAITRKGVTKAEVARHFGVKGPSVHNWIATGRIGKQHLAELIRYFSDVVGPEHWGLDADSDAGRAPTSRWHVEDGGPSLAELYGRAPPHTRAAVDLLLLPPEQRAALCQHHPHLTTGIALLEGEAHAALTRAKSA